MKRTRIVVVNKFRFFAFVLVALSLCVSLGLAMATRHASVAMAQGEPVCVVVSAGDTLWSIAREHANGGDVRSLMYDIMDANGLHSSIIKAGDTLVIPN